LAALKEALAEEEELQVLFMSADGDAINVANPGPWAELSTYLDLGLDIVVPDVEPDAYWQELSTEEARRYPADIVFQSTRAGSLTPDELQAHPTYSRHPAIAAGQVAPWNQDSIHSYQGLTTALDTLLQALDSSEKVID
jgi:iron complex transport system substrate-binding protein